LEGTLVGIIGICSSASALVYIIGKICDSIGGIAARRDHYPRNGTPSELGRGDQRLRNENGRQQRNDARDYDNSRLFARECKDEFHGTTCGRNQHRIYAREYAGEEPAIILMHGFPEMILFKNSSPRRVE
jgi:hypothetical protein